MSGARILIVEDDADINEIVATRLARAGHACTQAFSGSEARMLLEGAAGGTAASGDAAPPFDVVICDLMLPGMTGEELVGLIRGRGADVPVIVISARTEASDRIDLLKLGADDYLTKPFDLDELAARVEVQLRHRAKAGGAAGGDGPLSPGAKSAGRDGTLAFGDWRLDPRSRTFAAGGRPVELTRLEFNIVAALMREPGRAWSKAELFERAWGEPYAADDNTLNVHVSNIRAKLKGTGTEGYIKTVWGMGFKLAL